MAAAKKTTTKPAKETATEKEVQIAVPETEEKKSVKKSTEKKSAVKTAEEKPVEKKSAEKKPAVKAEAKKTSAKKPELKSAIHVQFAGKSYAQEDLVKIARDVWKYDLKQKAGALESVELYVKPEENMVYYVMNKEFTGSFYI